MALKFDILAYCGKYGEPNTFPIKSFDGYSIATEEFLVNKSQNGGKICSFHDIYFQGLYEKEDLMRLFPDYGNWIKDNSYVIYTDGAYSRKNDEGAFAYVIINKDGIVIKKGAWKIEHETNNRAELKAIIAALHHLPQSARFAKVRSDSQYALNTLFNGWARNANKDLFDAFERVMGERKLSVKASWVKGHSGDKYNEICDQMCNEVLGYDANAEYEKYKNRRK